MNFKHTLCAAVVAASVFTTAGVNAAGIEAFQEKVNKIAAQNGVPAPDVRKAATASGNNNSKSEEAQEEAARQAAINNVSPIERIVAINTETIRAIQAKDGRLMFLVDNGRFAFVGKMIDVWNRKELNSIEDIADAVSHIDLARMGFKIDKVNHISIGKGAKHVTAFVDPQCGWCHKLMAEINSQPELLNDYTFDFVIVPVLGERSNVLAQKLYCAKTTDQDKKYASLVGGARSIELLEQNADCDMEIFNQTRLIAKSVGVQGVPMVIAHDGRFTRGKPNVLKEFLEPAKTAPAKAEAKK